jgi:hypothetical protein
MHIPDMGEHLGSALAEVLETMFFTYVLEALDSGGIPAGTAAISSRLNFRGVPSGVFEIAIPMDAARTLAAGFLGEDETEISGKETGEVVCELANMLCGSFLSRIGALSTFELSHPEIVEAPKVASEAADACACFELPEGPLSLALRFENAV